MRRRKQAAGRLDVAGKWKHGRSYSTRIGRREVKNKNDRHWDFTASHLHYYYLSSTTLSFRVRMGSGGVIVIWSIVLMNEYFDHKRNKADRYSRNVYQQYSIKKGTTLKPTNINNRRNLLHNDRITLRHESISMDGFPKTIQHSTRAIPNYPSWE